jgi:hypothetical protein
MTGHHGIEPASGGPAIRADRRPYEPPQITSGPAFEKVVLFSGCPEGIFSCGASDPNCGP